MGELSRIQPGTPNLPNRRPSSAPPPATVREVQGAAVELAEREMEIAGLAPSVLARDRLDLFSHEMGYLLVLGRSQMGKLDASERRVAMMGYLRVLGDSSLRDLSQAVTAYLREKRWLPDPSEIYRLVEEARTRREAAEGTREAVALALQAPPPPTEAEIEAELVRRQELGRRLRAELEAKGVITKKQAVSADGTRVTDPVVLEDRRRAKVAALRAARERYGVDTDALDTALQNR